MIQSLGKSLESDYEAGTFGKTFPLAMPSELHSPVVRKCVFLPTSALNFSVGT